MPHFEYRSAMPVSAEDLFRYHARVGAFQRLLPPWQRISLAEPVPPLRNDSRVTFTLCQGPFRIRWIAQNQKVVMGQGFEDVQLRGPFKSWSHRHRFIADGPKNAQLEDIVYADLPFSRLTGLIGNPLLARQMARLFWFRHLRTFHDLAQHSKTRMTRSVLLVGGYADWCTAFASFLTTGGHRVFRLDAEKNGRFVMRPFLGGEPCHPLDQCDAIVLTEMPTRNSTQVESAIDQLDFLIRALRTLGQTPQRLIRIMSTDGTRKPWQDDPQIPATRVQPNPDGGSPYEARIDRLRKIVPRETRIFPGTLIHPNRNALNRLLLQLETFVFLGDQAQTPAFHWISREDFLGGLLFLIDREEITGNVTLTHPQPASRADLQRLFMKHFYGHYTLGRIFQVVGWGRPGQNPALNEYLRTYPNLGQWGFRCIAEDLQHAFEMEFGIPHSKPDHQMI